MQNPGRVPCRIPLPARQLCGSCSGCTFWHSPRFVGGTWYLALIAINHIQQGRNVLNEDSNVLLFWSFTRCFARCGGNAQGLSLSSCPECPWEINGKEHLGTVFHSIRHPSIVSRKRWKALDSVHARQMHLPFPYQRHLEVTDVNVASMLKMS